MPKSTSDLAMVARAGGSIELPAGSKSTSDICMIARAIEGGSAKLRLTGCDAKSTSDLCMIARAAPGQVTFSFE